MATLILTFLASPAMTQITGHVKDTGEQDITAIQAVMTPEPVDRCSGGGGRIKTDRGRCFDPVLEAIY